MLGLSSSDSSDKSADHHVAIKAAGEVLVNILQNHPEADVILKIDTEGSEYDIMESLSEAGVLQRVTAIVMETHGGRDDVLRDILEKHHFAYFCYKVGGNGQCGMIKAVRGR